MRTLQWSPQNRLYNLRSKMSPKFRRPSYTEKTDTRTCCPSFSVRRWVIVLLCTSPLAIQDLEPISTQAIFHVLLSMWCRRVVHERSQIHLRVAESIEARKVLGDAEIMWTRLSWDSVMIKLANPPSKPSAVCFWNLESRDIIMGILYVILIFNIYIYYVYIWVYIILNMGIYNMDIYI